MTVINPIACIVANAIFGIAGLAAAFWADSYVQARHYRALWWLIPAATVCAWLEAATSASVTNPALSESVRQYAFESLLIRRLIEYPIFTLLYL